MTDNSISITIRPTYEEFTLIHNKKVIDTLIDYLKDRKAQFIIGLETGKDDKINHYQIAISTKIHLDTIRRVITRIFKPHLEARTLKIGKWKLVRKHKDIKGLIGYCVKEDNVYSTNYSVEFREQASQYYTEKLAQKQAKSQKQAVKVKGHYCYDCYPSMYITDHAYQRRYYPDTKCFLHQKR